MEDDWLPQAEVIAASDDRLEAAVDVPASSAWFSGHFPGMPVLPGVAWLAAVAALARELGRRNGRQVDVTGFRHVRFRRRILSSVRAAVVLAPSAGAGPDELRFEVRIDDEPVAHGLIAVREGERAGA